MAWESNPRAAGAEEAAREDPGGRWPEEVRPPFAPSARRTPRIASGCSAANCGLGAAVRSVQETAHGEEDLAARGRLPGQRQGAAGRKYAWAARGPRIVTVQVVVALSHAPAQPQNVAPGAGVAVSVT